MQTPAIKKTSKAKDAKSVGVVLVTDRRAG